MRKHALVGIGAAAALALAGCSGAAGGGGSSGTTTAAASSAIGGSGAGSSPVPALASAGSAGAAGVAAAADPSAPSITTVGSGRVSGTPDVMTISLGVETRSASATQALEENNRLAGEVITALKDSGVDPADLQTSQLRVDTTQNDNNDITGYQVTNGVTATLRDLGAAGAVIDAAAQRAGDAVRVQYVSFSIDDDSGLRAEARAAAVRQAQAQAQQLAEAAGVQLGALRSITDSTSADQPVYYAAAAGGAADSAAPIEPGSQELSVTVQVVYDIAS